MQRASEDMWNWRTTCISCTYPVLFVTSPLADILRADQCPLFIQPVITTYVERIFTDRSLQRNGIKATPPPPTSLKRPSKRCPLRKRRTHPHSQAGEQLLKVSSSESRAFAYNLRFILWTAYLSGGRFIRCHISHFVLYNKICNCGHHFSLLPSRL